MRMISVHSLASFHHGGTRSARSAEAKVNCARPLEPKGWVTGLWRLKGSNQLQKWLSRLSISIPSSDINITRLELLSFPSNNSKADSSVLFQHISTFNQPRTHFRGVWTLNWRWIRIISATSLPEWLCVSCESGWQRKTALRYVNKHKKHLK